MDDVVTLIAAYAEEDRRLMELVARFPASTREIRGSERRLSVKQTLGHLAFWDDYAVRFYDSRGGQGRPKSLSPGQFEERNRQVLELICNDPFEDVLASYRSATRLLQGFLREHWQDLDARSRENFKIPLKHRRHHRRRLQELLAELGIGDPDQAVQERAG